jgi:TetR/AcrR family transcriptional regulator, regulator of autoinduction and epiphytic fitness
LPGARKGERGGATRARIVAAASTLFCEHGYLDTTMATIAAGAGVAVQTLYLSFGSKVAILGAAHDMAVVGDDDLIAVLDREWVAAARAEPDGLRALEVVMANVRRINIRVAPIYGAIQAGAADPEVAALLDQIRAQRLSTMRALAEDLATKPGFTPLHSADWAADILYAIASIEFLGLLTMQRQWSIDEYDAWVLELTASELFPMARQVRSRPRKRAIGEAPPESVRQADR